VVIVPIVVGPTGVGKTEIVLQALEGLDAEIISADSRQIYRLMDIGTAKPTADQRRRVRHHLVDCVDPDGKINAAQYGRQAKKIISELLGKGRLPVVVGGSGLYIRALLEGFFEGPGARTDIRRRLIEEETEGGPGTLHRRLTSVDGEAASRIHPHDQVRTMRALEVFQLTGLTLSQWQRQGPYPEKQFHSCKLGLYRDRSDLYQRIQARAEKMLSQGLLAEVSGLMDRGHSAELMSMSTVGYREMIAHLTGQVDLEEAVRRLVRNTRRYARRQMTWFGKEKDILWFHADLEAENFVKSLHQVLQGDTPGPQERARSQEMLRRCWTSMPRRRGEHGS